MRYRNNCAFRRDWLNYPKKKTKTKSRIFLETKKSSNLAQTIVLYTHTNRSTTAMLPKAHTKRLNEVDQHPIQLRCKFQKSTQNIMNCNFSRALRLACCVCMWYAGENGCNTLSRDYATQQIKQTQKLKQNKIPNQKNQKTNPIK